MTRSKKLKYRQKKESRKLRHLFGVMEYRDWCGVKDLTPYCASVGKIRLK